MATRHDLVHQLAWQRDVSALVANTIEAELEADWDEFSAARFAALLWVMARAAGYLVWLKQMGVLRAQAQRQGEDLPYWPSMPGFPRFMFAEIVREEARLRDGTLRAGVADIADRMTRRVMTHVFEMSRETVRAACEPTSRDAVRSRRYMQKHGHPVARMMADMATGRTEAARFVRSRPAWRKALGFVVSDFETDWAVPLANRPEDDWDAVVNAKDVAASQQAGVDQVLEDLRAGREAREEAKAAAREEAEYERLVAEMERRYQLERFGKVKGTKERTLGWARVPVGEFTCGFCLLLASRGPVYRTDTVIAPKWKLRRGAVPKIGGYGQEAYHHGCDCIAVPVWNNEWRIDKSNVGDQSGYDGEAVCDAAFAVYEEYRTTVWKHGNKNSDFLKWLNGPAGEEAARRLMPGMEVTAAAYRRIQRRERRQRRQRR